MSVQHLTAGAQERQALVLDDRDRCELLRLVSAALQGSILAYCVMDTHLHVVAEAPAATLERALRRYARWFNERHGRLGALLRGRVECFEKRDRPELVRAIRYTHANPLRTQPPLVEQAVDYPWSSEREYLGLSCARIANIERVRALAGFLPTLSRAPELAEAQPRRIPEAAPGLLIAAAAQAFAVHSTALAGPLRAGPAADARAVAVALCIREGYEHTDIAPFVGRSRQRVSRIAAAGVPDHALRIARTLLAERKLRARLPEVAGPALAWVVDEPPALL